MVFVCVMLCLSLNVKAEEGGVCDFVKAMLTTSQQQQAVIVQYKKLFDQVSENPDQSVKIIERYKQSKPAIEKMIGQLDAQLDVYNKVFMQNCMKSVDASVE